MRTETFAGDEGDVLILRERVDVATQRTRTRRRTRRRTRLPFKSKIGQDFSRVAPSSSSAIAPSSSTSARSSASLAAATAALSAASSASASASARAVSSDRSAAADSRTTAEAFSTNVSAATSVASNDARSESGSARAAFTAPRVRRVAALSASNRKLPESETADGARCGCFAAASASAAASAAARAAASRSARRFARDDSRSAAASSNSRSSLARSARIDAISRSFSSSVACMCDNSSSNVAETSTEANDRSRPVANDPSRSRRELSPNSPLTNIPSTIARSRGADDADDAEFAEDERFAPTSDERFAPTSDERFAPSESSTSADASARSASFRDWYLTRNRTSLGSGSGSNRLVVESALSPACVALVLADAASRFRSRSALRADSSRHPSTTPPRIPPRPFSRAALYPETTELALFPHKPPMPRAARAPNPPAAPSAPRRSAPSFPQPMDFMSAPIGGSSSAAMGTGPQLVAGTSTIVDAEGEDEDVAPEPDPSSGRVASASSASASRRFA